MVSAEEAIVARWKQLDCDAPERRELLNATVFLCELKAKKHLGIREEAS